MHPRTDQTKAYPYPIEKSFVLLHVSLKVANYTAYVLFNIENKILTANLISDICIYRIEAYGLISCAEEDEISVEMYVAFIYLACLRHFQRS